MIVRLKTYFEKLNVSSVSGLCHTVTCTCTHSTIVLESRRRVHGSVDRGADMFQHPWDIINGVIEEK